MAEPRSASEPPPPSLLRFFPVLAWLPRYPLRWLPKDLLAGALGAASSIPEAMAFAALAGLAVEAGLYVLLWPLLAYFFLGSSRELAIGPTGAVAALVAAAVLPLAGGDPAHHARLAAALGLMVAGLFFLAALLRLEILQSFVSRPVLLGYLSGAAVLICLTQLGPLMGASSEGRNAVEVTRSFSESWERLHGLSLLMGGGALAAVLLLRRLHWRTPAAAFVLLAAALLTRGLGLEVETVGTATAGLPSWAVPAASPQELWRLLPAALAIFLVMYFDSMGVARFFAHHHGYRIRPRQELRALGATNLLAGLSQGFPVGGNGPDTAFVEESGARSPVAAIVTVLIVILFLLAGGIFRYLPIPALNAVVIAAVVRSVDWRSARQVARFDRKEFAFLSIALLGVPLLGLLPGLLLAVFVNVVALLLAASRPHTAQLGREPGSRDRYGELAQAPGREPVPGVLLFKVDGSIFFLNAGYVEQEVLALVSDERQPTHAVVLELSAVPFIDFTGCEALAALERSLRARVVRVAVANPNAQVLAALGRYGLAEQLHLRPGRADINAALRQVLQPPAPAQG